MSSTLFVKLIFVFPMLQVKTEIELQEEVDLGPVFIDEEPHSSKRKATSPLMMNRDPELMSADDNLELITVEVVAGDEGKVRIKV